MFNRIRKKFSLSSQTGQVALIMILIIAVGLIFYAITLNWGRIAQYKTLTTVAANGSAAQMGSFIASYGQYLIDTELGGQSEKEDWSSLLEIVIAAIIVIVVLIIVIASGGTGMVLFAAYLAAYLAVASIFLEVAVIQPGLLSLWNKLQVDAPIEDRVVEQGIQAALQTVVTDSVQTPDKYDDNQNGKFTRSEYDKIGNSYDSLGNPVDDTMNRFGFYYTERLRSVIRKPFPEIKEFVDALNELVYENPFKKKDATFCTKNPTNLCCTASDPSISCPNLPKDGFGLTDPCADVTDPRCNPCCVPLDTVNPNYDPQYCVKFPEKSCCETFDPSDKCPDKPRIRLRPSNCPVNPKCDVPYIDVDAATSPNISYPWVYDRYALDNSTEFISYREKLGFDDEHRNFQKDKPTPLANQTGYINNGIFRPEDASGYFVPDRPYGIFPFIWTMAEWGVDLYSASGGAPNYINEISTKPNHCQWCSSAYSGCLGVKMADGVTNMILPATVFGVATPNIDQVNYTCQDADECCAHVFDSNFDTVGGRYGTPGIDSRKVDRITPPLNFAAADEECAHQHDGLDGLRWKKGGDMYCSEIITTNNFSEPRWPYYANCPKHGGKAGCDAAGKDADPNNNDCDFCKEGTPASGSPDDPRIWPNDPLDNFIYGMPLFLEWAKSLIEMPAASLRSSFPEWYDRAKDWIGEKCTFDCSKCDGGNKSCSDIEILECVVCNPGSDGKLRIWQKTLAVWAKQIDDWLHNTTYVGTNAGDVWCVPPANAVDPIANNDGRYMTLKEKNLIDPNYGTDPNAKWGDLNDILNCLNYSKNASGNFYDCHIDCSHANCKDMKRSLVDGFNPNKDFYDYPPPPDKARECLNADTVSCPSKCNDSAVGDANFISWKAHPQNALAPDLCDGVSPWAVGNPNYDAFVTAYNTGFHGYDLSMCGHPVLSPIFKEKLKQSWLLGQVQAYKIWARYEFLYKLRNLALSANIIFNQGSQKLKAFIDGPVAKLIDARKRFDESENKLPSFVIYGWESPTIPSWKQKDGTVKTRKGDVGYWHVVRVETFAPKRCYASPSGCRTDSFPWIKGEAKSFGFKLVYKITNTTGIVKVRVTRFDEDHDYDPKTGSIIPRFANNNPIWKFLYNKPGTPEYKDKFNASILGNRVDNGGCYGYGYTLQELTVEPPPEKAFMINRPPKQDKISNFDYDDKRNCWDKAHALLKRGIVTESCAQYYLNGDNMNVKFIKCPNDPNPSFFRDTTTFWGEL